MTQEQKISRGSITILILSVILLLCLCVTAVLAYFAGSQTSNMTLIMGGPVRVSIVDNKYEDYFGQGSLVMNIKTNRQVLLPGMGIDMQAIARVTSSDINPTNALLRAILNIEVLGIDTRDAIEVERQIRESMAESLTLRVDSKEQLSRDGWVQFDDGYYYYCSQVKGRDAVTGQEYIELKPIPTSAIGNNVPFINGTFQFPYRRYINDYANAEIIFNLSFQAIQDKIVNDKGERIPNTIFNVKKVLDSVDWEKHNN